MASVGFDVGTSFARVAVWHQDGVRLATSESGESAVPCCVAVEAGPSDRILVGSPAKHRAQRGDEPDCVARGTKSLLGRRFEDPEIGPAMSRWSLNLSPHDEELSVHLRTKDHAERILTPSEINGLVMLKLKGTAEAFLGTKVQSVALTVPLTFTETQRQAVSGGATKIGLTVEQIVEEPIAAAYAAGLHLKGKGDRRVLVIDIGGSKLEVTLLSIDDEKFIVKHTVHCPELGGDAYDARLAEWYHKQRGNPAHTQASPVLRGACSAAKCELSSSPRATISNPGSPDINISQAQAEEVWSSTVAATIDVVTTCISDAKTTKYQIHDVLLVGGGCNVPCVRAALQDLFKGRDLDVAKGAAPESLPALGAATLCRLHTPTGPATLRRKLSMPCVPGLAEQGQTKQGQHFLETQTLHAGRWLTLHRAVLRHIDHPTEIAGEWEFANATPRPTVTPDIVRVVAFRQVKGDNCVCVTSRFRPGLARVCIEFPSSPVLQGEEPAAAAVRCLREHTGLAGRVRSATPSSCATEPALTGSKSLFCIVDVDEGAKKKPCADVGLGHQDLWVPLHNLSNALSGLRQDHGVEVDSKLFAFTMGLELQAQPL
mmetsp:Transcript_27736/g.63890  ORF Transcript_27736/g.63890 Transcript_27736/m.63890 type:complete len:600 (+) Transcript_27736:3-1802(+)